MRASDLLVVSVSGYPTRRVPVPYTIQALRAAEMRPAARKE